MVSGKGPALVEVQEITFVYPDGRRALDRVSLVLQPGERVALVGPNGAGKSTLLLVLSGLLPPTEGLLRWKGKTITDGIRTLRGRVGLLFQDPDDQLFTPTVFEEVAFALLYQGLPDPEIAERVRLALETVGMAEAAGRAPHHLSVGEKKRVALATLLALQPELWLLDEPTSGLDPRGQRELVRLLQTLPGTLLVATHDLRLAAALCERVVVLNQGRVAANGPTHHLLADRDLLEEHGLVGLEGT